MDLHLHGKHFLITGGSRGIGRAIALGFAAEGADVSICARDAGAVEETVVAVGALGVRAFGRALEVAREARLRGAWALPPPVVLRVVRLCGAFWQPWGSWLLPTAARAVHALPAVTGECRHLRKAPTPQPTWDSHSVGLDVPTAHPGAGAGPCTRTFRRASLGHWRRTTGKGRKACPRPALRARTPGVTQTHHHHLSSVLLGGALVAFVVQFDS